MAISIVLTLVLVLGASTSKHIAVFNFTLKSADLTLSQDVYVIESDGTSKVHLWMKSSNPHDGGLYLWVQAQGETLPRVAATILNDDVSWLADFGSRAVRQGGDYTFKVTDESGQNALALGDVRARVYAVDAGWLRAGLFISTLASILQFVAFLGQRDR